MKKLIVLSFLVAACAVSLANTEVSIRARVATMVPSAPRVSIF